MADASGILNSDEVIFYHPLNDFQERTQLQTWSGNAGFTGGKIPLGLSAATTNVLEFNERYESGFTDTAGNTHFAHMLDATHSAVNPSWAMMTEVSGTTITFPGNKPPAGAWKDAILARDESLYWMIVVAENNRLGNYRITKSNGSVTWGDYDNITGSERLGSLNTVDGTFLLANSDGTAVVSTIVGLGVSYGSGYTFTSSSSFSVLAVAGLSSGVAVIIYRDNDSPRNGAAVARVASVSGEVITFGDEVQITANDEEVAIGHTLGRSHVSELDSSRFLYAYKSDTDPFSGSGIVGEVSGDTITFGSAVEFFSDPDTALGPLSIHAGKSIDNKVPITYCARYEFPGWHGFTLCRVLSVSGTIITSVGGQTVINSTTTDSFAGAYVGGATAFLESGVVITSYRDFEDGNKVKAAIGQFSSAALMTASSGDAYPVASGNDRVILATWAKNITKNASTVTIQRDYQIELTNTSITLGPDSIAWSGSAISGVLMGTDAGEMNDGLSHLLILDFEHTVGGSWNLSTSVDGEPWIDQGAGTGTRSIDPSGSDPNLDIADGKSDQWLDELVMWAGDQSTFDKFTNEELVNLYNLANTFGLEMDQYGQIFMISSSSDLFIMSNVIRASSDLFIVGPRQTVDSVDLFISAPIGVSDQVNLFIGAGSITKQGSLFILGHLDHSASGDLYIPGTVTASGSIPLFIPAPPPDLYLSFSLYMNGHDLVPSSGILARPLDWFLKTSDYNPQIIGTFENVAGSVTIQVWDVTDGQNIEMSLTSSGCYQIGDTGRWGWSTINLPTNQAYSKQYFYLMTSDIVETFDGQFFLDIPERAKWIHPNDLDEYVASV